MWKTGNEAAQSLFWEYIHKCDVRFRVVIIHYTFLPQGIQTHPAWLGRAWAVKGGWIYPGTIDSSPTHHFPFLATPHPTLATPQLHAAL